MWPLMSCLCLARLDSQESLSKRHASFEASMWSPNLDSGIETWISPCISDWSTMKHHEYSPILTVRLTYCDHFVEIRSLKNLNLDYFVVGTDAVPGAKPGRFRGSTSEGSIFAVGRGYRPMSMALPKLPVGEVEHGELPSSMIHRFLRNYGRVEDVVT